MKQSHCHCGQTVYFENDHCLACSRTLGFDPERLSVITLEPDEDGLWHDAAAPERRFRNCANGRDYGVCNWLVPAADPQSLCVSCRLNAVVPDLSLADNRQLWARVEAAKRRLLYTLYRLGLPVVGRDRDPENGLRFHFLANATGADEFGNRFDDGQRVVTGHRTGAITINIAEADPEQREAERKRQGEVYRTLLGHFRHESGHYFWEQWFPDAARRDAFRTCFGDERGDYAGALERHYREGPPAAWYHDHVSAYAAAHPWEDWAESWAHYLHMADTLETARDHGLALDGEGLAPAPTEDGTVGMARWQADWRRLTETLNALNRSMGQDDPYPFILTERVVEKLSFIHRCVLEASGRG